MPKVGGNKPRMLEMAREAGTGIGGDDAAELSESKHRRRLPPLHRAVHQCACTEATCTHTRTHARTRARAHARTDGDDDEMARLGAAGMDQIW